MNTLCHKLLIVVACCLTLSGCGIIRPILLKDTKERICNRSGDLKEIDAAEIARSVSEGFIGSVKWSFDEKKRATAEMVIFNTVEGDYEIVIDFHEPLENLSFSSPIGRLKAGRHESFKVGPIPYVFEQPLFAEVSLLLVRKEADGRKLLVDEADTFFLKDTDLVNDRALTGLNTGGLNAEGLLNKYSPILKTDIVTNPNTGIRFVDPGPKDIAKIIGGAPDITTTERAMIKGDLWEDTLMSVTPTPENMSLFNGRKDDYFIDLPQPFDSATSLWRSIVDKYPNAIYGRAVRTPLLWGGKSYRDAVILQYWLPYYVNHLALLKVNPKGVSWIWNAGNYHEGEVENISIALIPGKNGLEPLCASYAKHLKGTAEPWENVRKHAPYGTPTSHPVVYVANGSHASFFTTDKREATCGTSIDADMHSGGGFWYGDKSCDSDLGKVKVLPNVNGIKGGDEFDFLLFTGRFGGSYIQGAVNQFNRSPYLFPYVVYPKFSITGNWVAGSGVHRWIDPAGEIQYSEAIPSNLGFDHRNARFMFDTSNVSIGKEGGQISIKNLGFISENSGDSPAKSILIHFKDQHGNLKPCAKFDYRGTPPANISVPSDVIHDGTIELVACDLVPPLPAKFPLKPYIHTDLSDYFRTTSTTLIVKER
ncbi:MAG: hypothetical protein WCG31_03750 [Deltaproteobacteria bacterium]